ncbi:uncharacterized protein METZ01_LOCUS513252, partial [marine metagenome]
MADETPTTVEEVLPEEGGGTEFDTPTKLTESLTGKLATQADVIPAIPPKLPTGTAAVSTPQVVKEEEELFPSVPDLPQRVPATQEASITGLEIAAPPREAAATYQSFVEEGTPEFAAAQGQVSAESLIGDIQGAVSAESQALAQTEQLDEKATVQFQL